VRTVFSDFSAKLLEELDYLGKEVIMLSSSTKKPETKYESPSKNS
jgi:hypothetical protein